VEQNRKTAAADASVDHDVHQGLLDELMERVASCFARRETRLTCRDMVHGLLSGLEDRNCWTMAEAAGHPGPHRMQHLLSRARCDEQRMLDAAADWAAGHLSAGQGDDGGDVGLIVDETADEKSSDGCAGAARQYSGTVGGIALCQVAVTLTYAAPAGHALIGRALYLPEGWAADVNGVTPDGTPGGHDDSYFLCWSPHPVPLAKLIAVAAARWRIEEDHQLSKQVSGLDSGQVTHLGILAPLDRDQPARLRLPRSGRRLPARPRRQRRPPRADPRHDS
jgi:SRSO17 transposase